MTGKTVSHYEVKEQLGKGGMGIVYRARDTKLDRDIALKFLPSDMSADDEAKARFVQEAKAASALDHPNICTIHEIGESDEGNLFIAMSFYEGQTLKYLLDDGAIPIGRAANIATQIAAGLRKAHQAGIVHRDIKPANIMVTDDGLVKILDFGLAKLGQGIDLTKAGSTVGTTAYMSPEQSSGKAVDGRTDIWSLGVILYELLSGNKAFGGGYDQAVLYSVLNEDPAPLEGVPEEFASVIMKMIAKDPDDRYATADEVLEALDPFSSGVTQIADSSVLPGKFPFPKWALPVTAVAVIALALVLWTVFSNSTETDGPSDHPAQANLIVILPFNVQGEPEMEYLSEGMVTILSRLLDGAGSVKTVDHAAVLERIQIQQGEVIGPAAGREYSSRFGAGRFILGSIVRVGSENQISARLYLADGTPEEESIAKYTGDDDFMVAVDVLAAGLVRGLLTNPDQDLSSLAAGTTSSFESLKHYLTAEKLTRAGRNEEAFEEIQASLRLDSTFALAWYLRAEIDGWINVLSGAVQHDLSMAMKYADQLTGRARRLLEAELLFNAGRAREAARMYRAIIRDYPDDLEATGQLAEVFVHYSNKESEHLEALQLLEKVSELTPGSQQFAMHHSDLLAYSGLLNGDFYRLDSLAAVYAGMEIPARGEELDWSRALDRMNPGTQEYMVQHARVAGSPEDSSASFDREGSRIDIHRALWYGLVDHADASFSRTGHDKDSPWNEEWYIARSRGQFDLSNAMSPTVADDAVAPTLIVDVLDGTLSAFDTTDEMLLSLDKRVDDWDFATDPPHPYTRDGELVRAYLKALLAFRQNNSAGLEAQVNTYNSLTPDSVAYPIWVSISVELEALQEWLDGDIEAALTTMNAALMDGLYFLEFSRDLLAARHQVNWFLAELSELNGDVENAIDWYKASVYQSRYAPAGWERAAILYEQLGNTDEAIRYYSLMANQWRNADPVFQPRVAAAHSRIGALLDNKAREPQ